MTLQDNRLESIGALQKEIESLEVILKKKHKLHESLSQSLLNLVGKPDEVKGNTRMFQDSERIQQLIRENLTDIHHLDTKIAKMRHRANRMKHMM